MKQFKLLIPLLVLPKLNAVMYLQDPDMLKKTQGVGPIRKIVLVKDDHEGLGISITVRSHNCYGVFCVCFLS